MEQETRAAASIDDVLAEARRVAEDVAGPAAEENDRLARWPEDALRALQQAGLGGLVVAPEDGGLGHGLFGLASVCEALGRACASTAICFGMHCVGSAVIAAKATDAQRRRYLQPIARGEHLTTLSLSEAGSGVHFYLPSTELEPLDETTFRVTGSKTFVTNGGHADSYVISTVAADPGAPAGEFSCVIVDGSTDGLEWGDPWLGFGMRGNDSRTLRLEGVSVPRANLLGQEGEEIWYVFNVIAPYFLTAMAGTYLGVAGAALDEARAHVARRAYSTTGRSLAANPIMQHRLATLWAMVERTRGFVFAAARAADGGSPDALPGVLSSKAEVADCAVHVTNEAMTMTGGIAYAANGRLARCLRDARAAHVMAPTTDVLRTWAGRALLGQPLLSD